MEPENGVMPAPGIAEHQLGASSSRHLGWYSRGYLPHCDHPGILQVITYHLADSLPANAVARIEAELRLLPPDRQDPERRRRLDAWLDAGHGSCLLSESAAAVCVVDNWRHFARVRYDLIAWVVMPNHVHLLIRTYQGIALGKIVQSWKSYTGRRLREQLMARTDSPPESPQPDGVWMRDYWDRYIRNEEHFQTAIRYIHQNPVKAGLVKDPRDWPWSSAPGFGDPGIAEHQLGA